VLWKRGTPGGREPCAPLPPPELPWEDAVLPEVMLRPPQQFRVVGIAVDWLATWVRSAGSWLGFTVKLVPE
jgi:hypothetical protein